MAPPVGNGPGIGPAPRHSFDLARFLEAQEPTYSRALAELRRGRKTTHWMWFIFPQLAGLGHSEMSRHYAIPSLEEACQYLRHPVLGARLRECTAAVNSHSGVSITDILGRPDDMKFHSCMTLFRLAEPATPEFTEALDKYFSGELDSATVALLGQAATKEGKPHAGHSGTA